MSSTSSPQHASASAQTHRDSTRVETVNMKLTVVAGGVRSGKSRLAMEFALGLGENRAFVATAQAFDDEMRERIEQHRRDRSDQFVTIEAPRRLADVASTLGTYDVILLDCLTLYVSNLLLGFGDVEDMPPDGARQLEEATLSDLRAAVGTLRQKAKHLIVVTNEVGMGVVPVSRLGRLFRDVAGRVNQWIAGEASEVWLCALGIPMRIKPQPLAMGHHFVADRRDEPGKPHSSGIVP